MHCLDASSRRTSPRMRHCNADDRRTIDGGIMTKLHPARTIPFRELVDALRSALEARLVSEKASPDGLRIYCYTQSCVFDGQWNDATLIARGLVLDVERQTVAATPFPKFFNAFERGETIPDLPFETFEKVDGSLDHHLLARRRVEDDDQGHLRDRAGAVGCREAQGVRSFGAPARHHLPCRGRLPGEPHRRALRRGRAGAAGRL
jgi:hypothetical protein